MCDYSKAIIYTIRTGNNIYVGSTINFRTRKNHHKSNIYNEKSHQYNLKLYQTIRANGGEWDMKPYKEFPCENKTQLTIEEQRVRCELNADLNSQSCGTGLDRTNIKDYKCEWYKNNRDKEKEKKYRIENKEKISERKKQYYQKNRQNVLDRIKEKITCECGCVVTKKFLSKHKKTPKHQKLINN